MTAKQRRDTLSMWEGGDASDAPVMIATKAFGLGIDRPDVSLVVQMGLADDIAEWWQMSGRAARSEGARGLSVTFVHPRFVTERLRIVRPTHESDLSSMVELINFLSSPGCLRERALTFLGGSATGKDRVVCCSRCELVGNSSELRPPLNALWTASTLPLLSQLSSLGFDDPVSWKRAFEIDLADLPPPFDNRTNYAHALIAAIGHGAVRLQFAADGRGVRPRVQVAPVTLTHFLGCGQGPFTILPNGGFSASAPSTTAADHSLLCSWRHLCAAEEKMVASYREWLSFTTTALDAPPLPPSAIERLRALMPHRSTADGLTPRGEAATEEAALDRELGGLLGGASSQVSREVSPAEATDASSDETPWEDWEPEWDEEEWEFQEEQLEEEQGFAEPSLEEEELERQLVLGSSPGQPVTPRPNVPGVKRTSLSNRMSTPRHKRVSEPADEALNIRLFHREGDGEHDLVTPMDTKPTSSTIGLASSTISPPTVVPTPSTISPPTVVPTPSTVLPSWSTPDSSPPPSLPPTPPASGDEMEEDSLEEDGGEEDFANWFGYYWSGFHRTNDAKKTREENISEHSRNPPRGSSTSRQRAVFDLYSHCNFRDIPPAIRHHALFALLLQAFTQASGGMNDLSMPAVVYERPTYFLGAAKTPPVNFISEATVQPATPVPSRRRPPAHGDSDSPSMRVQPAVHDLQREGKMHAALLVSLHDTAVAMLGVVMSYAEYATAHDQGARLLWEIGELNRIHHTGVTKLWRTVHPPSRRAWAKNAAWYLRGCGDVKLKGAFQDEFEHVLANSEKAAAELVDWIDTEPLHDRVRLRRLHECLEGHDLMKVVLDAGMQIAKRGIRSGVANKTTGTKRDEMAATEGSVGEETEAAIADDEGDDVPNSDDEDDNTRAAQTLIAYAAQPGLMGPPPASSLPRADDDSPMSDVNPESETAEWTSECATCRERKGKECFSKKTFERYTRHTQEGRATQAPRCLDCIEASKAKTTKERAWRYNLGILNMSELAMIGNREKGTKLKELRHLLDFGTQVCSCGTHPHVTVGPAPLVHARRHLYMLDATCG